MNLEEDFLLLWHSLLMSAKPSQAVKVHVIRLYLIPSGSSIRLSQRDVAQIFKPTAWFVQLSKLSEVQSYLLLLMVDFIGALCISLVSS
jgi:hypothetical protein